MKSYGARSTVLLVLAFIFIQHVVANSVQDDVALLRDALPADIAKRRAALIRKAEREPLDCKTEPSVAWIHKYAAWHAEALKKPEKAKFLLVFCQNNPVWAEGPRELADVEHVPCGGAGDRIRAMVEALRLAAYSERVLLFYWAAPMDVEDALAPADLDWRVQLSYGLREEKNRVVWQFYNFKDHGDWPQELVDGSWKTVHADKRLVAISTNLFDEDGVLSAGQPLGPKDGFMRSCAFNALFKPSEELAARVAETRKYLFGSPTADYVALHLRMGGMQTEKAVVARFDQMKGLMASLLCAKDLSDSRKLNQSVLVITDNALLRWQVAFNYFSGVVGPKHVATHLDKGVRLKANIQAAQSSGEAGAGPPADHLGTFVDLLLLAEAKCFVGSPSGFSTIASLWGAHSCYTHVGECLDSYGIENMGRACTTLGRRLLRGEA